MPGRKAKSERTLANRRYAKIVQRVLQPVGDMVEASLLDDAATILGFLVDGQLDLRGEYELGTVLYFALFEVQRDGESTVERYVRTHPPDLTSREGRVLRALPEARLTVFLIDGVEEGVGIQVHDMLGGPPAFVANALYADPAFLGERFAGRLLTVDDVTISVGGFLPLDEMATEEILYDLIERFPGRPVDSLHTVSGQDRTDAAVIVASAGIESTNWMMTQAIEDLEGIEELDAAALADALPPSPPSSFSRRKRWRT